MKWFSTYKKQAYNIHDAHMSITSLISKACKSRLCVDDMEGEKRYQFQNDPVKNEIQSNL